MDKVVRVNDWSVNVIWHIFTVIFLKISILLSCLDQFVHYAKSPHSLNNGRNLEVRVVVVVVGWGCMCGSVRACVPSPAAEQVINSEHCPPVNSSPLLK